MVSKTPIISYDFRRALDTLQPRESIFLNQSHSEPVLRVCRLLCRSVSVRGPHPICSANIAGGCVVQEIVNRASNIRGGQQGSHFLTVFLEPGSRSLSINNSLRVTHSLTSDPHSTVVVTLLNQHTASWTLISSLIKPRFHLTLLL